LEERLKNYNNGGSEEELKRSRRSPEESQDAFLLSIVRRRFGGRTDSELDRGVTRFKKKRHSSETKRHGKLAGEEPSMEAFYTIEEPFAAVSRLGRAISDRSTKKGSKAGGTRK